jgi:hypothetical protein
VPARLNKRAVPGHAVAPATAAEARTATKDPSRNNCTILDGS